MPDETAAPPSREPIYRTIRLLLLFDLLLGLALLVVAGPLWGLPSLQIAGGILALIGGGLYLFFGHLAARERQKRN
ncbi:MAG TPA: hypothetical protein VKB42_07620 [Dongiaceae bacterium]|nr:hypothetical protein [Dongiaceae bacterium]